VKIPILKTDRLIFRGYAPFDFSELHTILLTKEAVRYFTHSEPWTEERLTERIANIHAHWEREGFGVWILEHRADRKPIGWCGLRRPEDSDDVDVLCLLSPNYWGRGLANEASGRSLDYAFDELGLEEIFAFVPVENARAIRVLEGIGMHLREHKRSTTHDYYVFGLNRTERASLSHGEVEQ
jgi:ribosomal-protein-alanine N-acetyltransferase